MPESKSVSSELFEHLRELLGLPAKCTSVILNLELGEIPSVKITYYLQVEDWKKLETVTQKFEIVLRESE